MATDESVFQVMESALDAAPDNHAVRRHLIDLLAADARWDRVLPHCEVLLRAVPDDVPALRHAATASEYLGDTVRADGYRRLATALGGADGPTPTVPPSVPVDKVEKVDKADKVEKVEKVEKVPVEKVPAERMSADGAPADEDDFDRFLREVVAEAEIEHPTLRLSDVGGLEDVKKRLTTSFLAPMRNPELRAMYGKSLRGGLLLYGPPGCGKTYLARAVAGELGAHFIGVGLNDVLDMWLGRSEQNLHAIFESARRQAPCVLFMDEVDALGLKRSNLSHSAGRNVVVQLLTELDNTRDDNEGVFVLGATNAPWDLDPALRRPGRFDRTLLVLPPDAPARAAILAHHLRERPVQGIDVERVARQTDGYSGADLRLVCESAAELAMAASIESGTVRPIGPADVEHALGDVRPSTGPWFETAKNYAMFANEGGTYDDLLAYIRKHRLG